MTPVRLALALVCVASVALATNHPEEARKLSLKQRKGHPSLSWAVRVPPPVLPAASPVAIGATLEIRTQASESASIDLPASGWTLEDAGRTFKFRNPSAPSGVSVIEAVTLRSQRSIKARGKGTGVTLDEVSQGAVTIALVIGDDIYCSTCTTPRRDEPGRFIATHCAPPADCSLTTTTTTSSTTTSSFVPGVCGNGVRDQASEECDAPDRGACTFLEPMETECTPPGAEQPCACCGVRECPFEFVPPAALPCCGDSQCQDTRGFGTTRSGVCIPPSCTQTSDCNAAGYDCVGGTCCAKPGSLCGVVSCCPGSGASCTFVGLDLYLCCRPPGGTCEDPFECCSLSCTGGVCD